MMSFIIFAVCVTPDYLVLCSTSDSIQPKSRIHSVLGQQVLEDWMSISDI